MLCGIIIAFGDHRCGSTVSAATKNLNDKVTSITRRCERVTSVTLAGLLTARQVSKDMGGIFLVDGVSGKVERGIAAFRS